MARTPTAASHRVIAYGLALLDDLRRGVGRDLDREQAALTNLLLEVNDATDDAPDRGARYALVCWLDEVFIDRSPWSVDWNAQKLESALYGGNDRAWEFWRQANLAAARPNNATLGVYFLCVALGFRGELRDKPSELAAWVEKTRTRVTHVPTRDDGLRRASVRRRRSSPPRGAARLRRFAAVACAVTVVALPLAAYAVVQRLLG